MRTRTLADGFFTRKTRGGLPAEFGWRARRGNFSAALTEARNWRAGNPAGASDAAFALGANRWRGVELAAGAVRAGFRAAEFSATDALLRQWFLARDFAGGGWSVSPEAGIFDEDGSVLGAGFAGGFAAEGARTFYGKVNGAANLGFGLRGFAGALLAQTSAENGRHSARFSDLRSGGWQAGLSGERWQFSFWRPAGVLSGEMRVAALPATTNRANIARPSRGWTCPPDMRAASHSRPATPKGMSGGPPKKSSAAPQGFSVPADEFFENQGAVI